GVLCTGGAESPSGKEALSAHGAMQTAATPRAQSLGGQSQRIANSRGDEAAENGAEAGRLRGHDGLQDRHRPGRPFCTETCHSGRMLREDGNPASPYLPIAAPGNILDVPDV